MLRLPIIQTARNIWGILMNRFHAVTAGDHEYFYIVTNGNNPPTIKANTRFQVYKEDNSYTIDSTQSTGDNEYVAGDTPTYPAIQGVIEPSDVTSTYAGTADFPSISDGTWYMYCRGCLDTNSTTRGKGSYWISKTDAPAIDYKKGGYYNTSDGLSRCLCQWTVASSVVSALIIYKAIMPYTMGSSGQRLTSNGDGTTSWSTPSMVRSVIAKTADYVILDNDGYDRIEVDTTSGDITITLPTRTDNLYRRIEIANVKGGTNKVIIAADGGESKITADGLASVWLPKIGDYIVLEESATSGFWEVVDEKITSQLRLDVYAGYGSTDTKIARFTNVTQNIGNMFSENHVSGYTSNQKGLEITAKRTGALSISINWYGGNGASHFFGLSLNSAQLTTSFASITATDRLTADDTGVTQSKSAAIDLMVNKNDVIRVHTDGGAPFVPAVCFIIIRYNS